MTSRMSSNVETIIPPSLQSFALCRLLLPARSRRAVLLIASFIFSPSPSLSLFFPSPSPPLSSSSINSIISLLTVVCLSLPFLLTFFFFFFPIVFTSQLRSNKRWTALSFASLTVSLF